MEYAYDADGRMTADANRGIASVEYNAAGLPWRVRFSDGALLTAVYDASGRLLQRTVQGAPLASASGLVVPARAIPRTYVGPAVFKASALERVLVPGGHVQDGAAYAWVTDHQGNVRQVVDLSDGSVAQETHYYPYGAAFGECTAQPLKALYAPEPSPWRYAAKERLDLDELDAYDFGPRLYEPTLCRFLSPDPLAEKTPGASPYLYCLANPMRFFDPTGCQVEEERADALKRIDYFMENYSGPSFFKNIDKASFGNNLRTIVENPKLIYQGNNGTCGAAVFLKYLTETNPVGLVNLALSLHYCPEKFSHNRS